MTCARAARGCYSPLPSADIGPRPETVAKVLRNAVASGHTSVLEHATFTFSISGISRICTHQLVRHRHGSYSQQSQRYVEDVSPGDLDGYVLPQTILGRMAAERETAEAGGLRPERDIVADCPVTDAIARLMDTVEAVDRLLRDAGIPAEDRRAVYPACKATAITVTVNARTLREFFALRCCNRAQEEIRGVAWEMLRICKEVAPVLFEGAGPLCLSSGCREVRPCGKAVR